RGPASGRPALARLGVARSRHVDLSLGPFHGLVEPTSDILPDRVADRVLDRHGVARLHELLEIDDIPFWQFDHELADVVRRELHVDETIDRRANRVGNRRVVAALDELMQRLDFVRGNSDRNPLGFRWHMDPSPCTTCWVILSDIRMATALYKRTVQTVHRSCRRRVSDRDTELDDAHSNDPKLRRRRGYSALIRLFFGLCSTSAKWRTSSTGGTYMPNLPRSPFFNPYHPPTGFFRDRPHASIVPSAAGFCSSALPRSIQSPRDLSIECRSPIAPKVILSLRAPRRDDERWWIERLVTERQKLRRSARRL